MNINLWLFCFCSLSTFLAIDSFRNGQDAWSWPWIVRVEMKHWLMHKVCSGALVEQNIVITAKSCADTESQFSTPTKYLKVIVNDHHTNEYGDKHISAVSKIITPPENLTIDPFDYQRRSWFRYPVHDSAEIVLLLLLTPVSSCRFGLGLIRLPFGLPSNNLYNASAEKNLNDSRLLAAANSTRPPFVKNLPCYFAGWGAVTNESAEIGGSTILKQATVNFSNAQCPSVYKKKDRICSRTPNYIHKNLISAGNMGGPLMCKEADGIWKLYGIMTDALRDSENETVVVYTNIAYYKKWIVGICLKHISEENLSFQCNIEHHHPSDYRKPLPHCMLDAATDPVQLLEQDEQYPDLETIQKTSRLPIKKAVIKKDYDYMLNDERMQERLLELAANLSLLVKSSRYGGGQFCFTTSTNQSMTKKHTVVVTDSGGQVCFSEWIGYEELTTRERQCVWKLLPFLNPVISSRTNFANCFMSVLPYYLSKTLLKQRTSNVTTIRDCLVGNGIEYDRSYSAALHRNSGMILRRNSSLYQEISSILQRSWSRWSNQFNVSTTKLLK